MHEIAVDPLYSLQILSANSVGNINPARSLQKSNLLADKKDPQNWIQVVVWIYTFIVALFK